MNRSLGRVLATLAAILCFGWKTAWAAEKPNIVIFLVDDMGLMD
jgi:hypothetical protein